MTHRTILLGALASIAVAAVGAAPAGAFDLQREVDNYLKGQERQALYMSVQGQLLLRKVSAANQLAAFEMQLTDTERLFAADLCGNGMDGCAGDARLYDWQAKGYGIVQPVLFTARSGATLSGHVWATKAGPERRPGVVITNGSVQADEQMYWPFAQALAKAGYVVLTFDPQGQGQSDTPGAGPDALEGVPAQTDGRPFFDGAEDALNFFFSNKEHPYVPVNSCMTGTSHADKQERRVKAGLDAAYNPFWQLLDPSRVGVAGHSYGAAGVSYVGQADPRVKAIVAWDNIGAPDPAGRESGCVDAAARKPVPITKPALGMSGDYGIDSPPYTSDPAPLSKSTQSLAYTKAGVDTGEIIIRGGTHLDFSFISNPAFFASLRGPDVIAWYTTAWMDKYVKGDPTADARLLTARWLHDGQEAVLDPEKDGNAYSFYFPSRLNFHRANGTPVVCDDLRKGCASLSEDDGYVGDYSYIATDTTPDGLGFATVPKTAGINATQQTRCVKSRSFVMTIPHASGVKVRRVRAYVKERLIGESHGTRVRLKLPSSKGTHSVRLFVTARRKGHSFRTTILRRYRIC